MMLRFAACSLLPSVTGMLFQNQQPLATGYLLHEQPQYGLPSSSIRQPADITLLPARKEHLTVEAEVARERVQYTETGQSLRERELLANMGRMEDQLEAYRRLGPSLEKHIKMQADTAKSLKALEAKAHRIEQMAATLWWDSKMLMCGVAVSGFALCLYASSLNAQQNSEKPWPLNAEFDAAAPKEGPPQCEYFSLAEGGDGLTPEERWWMQPCGPKTGPEGSQP